MSESSIPTGFTLLPTGLGFLDNLTPCYRRITDEGIQFGIRVDAQHANSMGLCHGGVLMTLADCAAASGVNFVLGKRAGSPTINLSVDFISAAKVGEWIQTEVDHVSVKRRFGFCSGIICNEEGIVSRFNGTFYLPDHKGMWKANADKALAEDFDPFDQADSEPSD